jgi:CubicO group peptidase (beta-lactamase class C family)
MRRWLGFLLLGIGIVVVLGAIWFARQVLALYREDHAYRRLDDTHDLDRRIAERAAGYAATRPGVHLVVGVWQRGRRWVGGFGDGRPVQAAAPDARIAYEIGSITKVFTALLLARAKIEGQCDLDDPIGKFLPAEAGLPEPIRVLTLRQLATHTSGLPRLPENLDATVRNDDDPYSNYRADDLLACLRDSRPRVRPGTKSDYSNLGAGLLGYVLAQRSGKPYEELLRASVLDPLGMRDTVIHLSDEQRARLIGGHEPGGKPVPNWTFDVMAPAGALRSTAEDMLTFLDANLAGREGDIGRVLKLAQEVHHGRGRSDRVGLGWQIHTDIISGHTIHWHNGGTGGYRSFLGFDAANQVGIVLLSNYGDAFGDDPLDGISFSLLRTATKVSLAAAGQESEQAPPAAHHPANQREEAEENQP